MLSLILGQEKMTIPSAITQFEKCTHCVAGVGEEPRALHARQDHQPRRRPWHWLHPQRSGAQVIHIFNAFPTKMDSCTFMPQTVQQTLLPHFPESQSCRLVQVHNKIWQNYILREIVLFLPNHSHDGFCGFSSNWILLYFPLFVCPSVRHRRDISHFSHI